MTPKRIAKSTIVGIWLIFVVAVVIAWQVSPALAGFTPGPPRKSTPSQGDSAPQCEGRRYSPANAGLRRTARRSEQYWARHCIAGRRSCPAAGCLQPGRAPIDQNKNERIGGVLMFPLVNLPRLAALIVIVSIAGFPSRLPCGCTGSAGCSCDRRSRISNLGRAHPRPTPTWPATSQARRTPRGSSRNGTNQRSNFCYNWRCSIKPSRRQ